MAHARRRDEYERHSALLATLCNVNGSKARAAEFNPYEARKPKAQMPPALVFQQLRWLVPRQPGSPPPPPIPETDREILEALKELNQPDTHGQPIGQERILRFGEGGQVAEQG